MSMSMSIFVSKRIFLGDDDTFINGGLAVNSDGKIKQILTSPEEIEFYKAQNNITEIIDFKNKVLMPGLIDSHVHINEPGRTDWEGFETATKAAAAGGFTTIVDMPLNSIPPTTTVDNLLAKLMAAQNSIFVDVILWGGVIPTNIDDLPKLIESGIKGFKCFLCPSGVDEFPYINRDQVESALRILENTGIVLAFHGELDPDSPFNVDKSHPEKYQTYLNTRPPSMEIAAISLISELAEKYKNARLHIVHLSAAEAVPIIRKCRENGGNLTVETCHHYLFLNAEAVPDYHTEFKCAPPIRDKENQVKLWEAVKNDDIDLLASDHSPCTPDLKLPGEGEGQGDFLKAWGGIASNQFGLPLFWTNCSKYGLGLKDVVKLMCRNPAKHCGVDSTKGKIAEGYDADFCIWDPNEKFLVTTDIIQFKNKVTPYMQKTLRGVVYATVLRGQVIYKKSEEFQKPSGQVLLQKSF